MTISYGPLLRRVILGGLLVLVIGVIAGLAGNPDVIRANGAASGIYLGLLALAVAFYGWFALARTRARTAGEEIALRSGTLLGLACGAAWLGEVTIANIVGPLLGPLNTSLYYLAEVTAVFLPAIAGFLAGRSSGHLATGLAAGLLCGLLGGLILFDCSIVTPALITGVQPDAQTLAEFQRSGMTSLQAYLVSDTLAATIAHLWIGILTGLCFGFLGSAVGTTLPAGKQAQAATSPRLKLSDEPLDPGAERRIGQ